MRPVITIDPGLNFGRPQIRGVSTSVVAELVLAGEDVDRVAQDYEMSRGEVLLCCWFEATDGDDKGLRMWWHAWAEKAGWLFATNRSAEIEDPPSRRKEEETK